MPKTSTYNKPFFHQIIPNFLNQADYKRVSEVYSKLQFKQKTSDLFHFFQTTQLATEKSLQFFRKDLSKEFKKLCTPEEFRNSSYSIFASYYFKGDYLLCHDDIIDDRKYAFSYYLQDFNYGGELVFFNDKANSVEKSIKVKKNTIAIFQVCDESYHQVAYCSKDGRKAITGWFNIKGLGAKRIPKSLDSIKFNTIKKPLKYPLDQAHVQQQYFQMQDIQYQFNIKKEKVEGPFYSRRVHRLEIDPPVIFTIPGYKLLSSDFYKIKKGDYLLLNDPVNRLQEPNMIDIFVTSLPQNYKKDEQNMLIKIVEEDGSLSGVPEVDDSLFIVHRQNKQYYIQRNQQQFTFAHFMYIKEQQKNVKTKIKNKKYQKKSKSKNSAKKNKTQSKTTKKKAEKKQTIKSAAKTKSQPRPLPKAKISKKIAKSSGKSKVNRKKK